MNGRNRRLLWTALLTAAFAACAIVAFSLGAVVGEFRPHLAKPWSDWALMLVLPLKEAYCDVADVTQCVMVRR